MSGTAAGGDGTTPPGTGGTLIGRLAAWGSRLELKDAPGRVVGHLKSQILSQLGAARAGYAHPLGAKILQAYGGPLQDDPQRAAHSLAMATICLDFDDTAYAGHLSHSCVNVPLVHSRPLGLDGRRLLTSVLAANECAARITAAATLGPFRGQTAGHTHLAGAVAARLRAERAPARTWADALGLAFSVPTWTLSRGFFSTDAKLLAAAVPVRIALGACDGARAGLAGPEDVLEHPHGFLQRFADLPLPEEAVSGLGSLWHTETFSYKVHPGSAYTSAAVDCAVDLHHRLAGVAAADITEVVVEGSLFTSGLDRIARRQHIGPGSSVAALNFSVPYNVATALLTGTLVPADLAPPAVGRPERWDLAARVRTEHDPAFSRDALLATAPLGQALRRAGPRAQAWVAAADEAAAQALPPSWSAPETDFRRATKNLGARVTVRLRDGRVLRAERRHAVGAASAADGADHATLARRKFLRCGGDPEAADMVAELEHLRPGEVERLVSLALAGTDERAGGARPQPTRKGSFMDPAALEKAYADLDTAATAAIGAEGREPAASDEPGVDWILAHIALSDRLLADTARQVIADAEPSLDNSPAMAPAAIEELTGSADRALLVELVRRNAAELVGLVAQTPGESGATRVAVRLVDGQGQEVFAGPVPWGEILRLRAEEQLPGHAGRLRRLTQG